MMVRKILIWIATIFCGILGVIVAVIMTFLLILFEIIGTVLKALGFLVAKFKSIFDKLMKEIN